MQTKYVISLFFLGFSLLFASPIFARVTPEDILNSKRESYNQKIKNYSPESKQKLEDLSQKISAVNRQRSSELLQTMDQQSLIFEEYLKRKKILETGGQDGINRNLKDPVEKTRYWITFAHEAVAFQSAKVYIFDLTNESNIKKAALNLISAFESELNSTRKKVIDSQNVLSTLLKND